VGYRGLGTPPDRRAICRSSKTSELFSSKNACGSFRLIVSLASRTAIANNSLVSSNPGSNRGGIGATAALSERGICGPETSAETAGYENRLAGREGLFTSRKRPPHHVEAGVDPRPGTAHETRAP
jgi:hypothetical protein